MVSGKIAGPPLPSARGPAFRGGWKRPPDASTICGGDKLHEIFKEQFNISEGGFAMTYFDMTLKFLEKALVCLKASYKTMATVLDRFKLRV